MDTSLINKHTKRLNFKEGKLDSHKIWVIDISTTWTEAQMREWIEVFKQRMSEATRVPAEYFGVTLERVDD